MPPQVAPTARASACGNPGWSTKPRWTSARPTRERMATPFQRPSPRWTASYSRRRTSSPNTSSNSASLIFVSCRQTTSGRRWSSQSSRRGRRARAELTFQVASRMAEAAAVGLLPEPVQCLVVEEARLERDPAIVRRIVTGTVLPRDGRAIGLDVLRALVAKGGAVPALLVVEVVAGEAHDLVDVQQIALPGELPVPRSLPGLVVDPQLELAVEVVLVLRDAFQHPEPPLRQRRACRRPGDALPVLHHEADGLVVVVGNGSPATSRERLALDLAGEAARIDETHLLPAPGELPGEVLRLAVEEEAVVLALVGAEEAVGAVRRRHRAHAPECRDVGPVQVPLPGILVAVAQRRGPLDVGRVRRDREKLEQQVLGIVLRRVLPWLAVVVEEVHVLGRGALDAGPAEPLEVRPVVAVAARVVRVREVPERLVARLGIALADAGERDPHQVVGPLHGRLVDGLLVLVEREALAVLAGRLVEAVVPAEPTGREVDDRVDVVAVLVVLVDLGREEIPHLVGRRPVDRRARRDVCADRRTPDRGEHHRESYDHDRHRQRPPLVALALRGLRRRYRPVAPTRAARASAAASSARIRCRSSA